jgi:predicted protein tyrosine phosphatase
MKRVEILSRTKAKHLSALQHIDSCVIISINDFDEYPNRFFENPQIKAVLHFTFDDIEDGDYAINETQAEEMARFVKFYCEKVDVIVVHCHAGISRSAGIGAAIMKWYFNDDMPVFKDPSFTPNMRCYRMMLNALMEE